MKKMIFVITLLLFSSAISFGQLDRSKMPKATEAPEIKIGDFESFQLDNGLKVFVVENEKLSGITLRLVLNRDALLEGDAAGYVQAAGQLMRTGTQKRTKDQLDEDIDFIGANISTSSSTIYGSALKKHEERLFELISDITLHPNFTQSELDKIKKKMLSNLAQSKDNPNSIAANVRGVLNYGHEHPYGEVMTEKTVENIDLEMCKNYYAKYFRPNIAYMAIVGNISKSDAEDLVEKYFSSWEKGTVTKAKYKMPKAPLVTKVAIVDRPASVQSVINVTYPVKLPVGSDDAIKVRIANQILGGSATARLFMNLREDKAYTYGAYSSISSDKLVGNFRANCEARNAVTDSAITEILKEMKKIRKEKVSIEELENVKNFLIGSFARSLESPQTVARFALNVAMYNLPKDYYKNYLKKINAVTTDDVLKAAKKYINPKKANILVVGNAKDVADNLKKFSLSGKVNYYDTYGVKYDPSVNKIPAGVTAESVYEKYVKAIGGKDKYLSIKDQTINMSGDVQGMKLELTISQKSPNKYYQKMGIKGMFEQLTVFDGEKGYASGAGQKKELAEKELSSMKIQANMYMYTNYKELGLTLKLDGVEKISGKDAYKLSLTLPSGTVWTQYFDTKSGFLVRQLTPISTPQGEFTSKVDFSDYKEVDGMMFPNKLTQSMGPQTVIMTLQSVELNKGLEDTMFK